MNSRRSRAGTRLRQFPRTGSPGARRVACVGDRDDGRHVLLEYADDAAGRCGWCEKASSEGLRPEAEYCAKPCRQANSRSAAAIRGWLSNGAEMTVFD